jgi:hypothetical protein
MSSSNSNNSISFKCYALRGMALLGFLLILVPVVILRLSTCLAILLPMDESGLGAAPIPHSSSSRKSIAGGGIPLLDFVVCVLLLL